MKVSLGKRLQSVVVVLVTKLQDEKFEKKNFDFLSSRVKRVKSCRFAKAKPIAFISVFVSVASVDREFKINLPRRLGRRKEEKFAFFQRSSRYKVRTSFQEGTLSIANLPLNECFHRLFFCKACHLLKHGTHGLFSPHEEYLTP